MYVIRWIQNGLTQRRFVRDKRDQVLPLLIAGQQLGYQVRVEIATERGLAPVDAHQHRHPHQRCDRIIQLWMPKMTHSVGSTIHHKDMSIEVDENLLFVKVGKQRGGLPSGRVWPCRINFTRGHIAPAAVL